MHITWSLVQQFVHCPRQAWLFVNNLKTEHTNENVKIWKILHNLKYDGIDNSEVLLDEIKLDKIYKKQDTLIIEEFKKSNKELLAECFQVLYYLYKLEEKWIKCIWKLIFDEKKKLDLEKIKDLDYKIQGFSIILKLTEKNKKNLNETLKNLKKVIFSDKIPKKLENKSWWTNKKCKWCSYYEFCWI